MRRMLRTKIRVLKHPRLEATYVFYSRGADTDWIVEAAGFFAVYYNPNYERLAASAN